MTWHLLLVPLAVLVILPPFAFIGCNFVPGDLPDPGPYAPTIEATPGLVAYWRLGAVDDGGAQQRGAASIKGRVQRRLPRFGPCGGRRPAPFAQHRRQDRGGSSPGLLTDNSDDPQQSQEPCILVDGGYVQIPANDALNPPVFTFECWIDLTGFDQEPEGNYYCLVESTGPANGVDPRSTGFGLYLGPQDPNALAGPYFWQVWMGDGTAFHQVAVGTQPVDASQSRLTYLALTFLGNNNSVNDGHGNDLNLNLALYLYRPDTGQDISSSANLQALTSALNNFTPNTVANGGGGDFFIATGSNLFPSQRLRSCKWPRPPRQAPLYQWSQRHIQAHKRRAISILWWSDGGTERDLCSR